MLPLRTNKHLPTLNPGCVSEQAYRSAPFVEGKKCHGRDAMDSPAPLDLWSWFWTPARVPPLSAADGWEQQRSCSISHYTACTERLPRHLKGKHNRDKLIFFSSCTVNLLATSYTQSLAAAVVYKLCVYIHICLSYTWGISNFGCC